MPPPPLAKTAQRVSANNILANHEDQSPTPALRDAPTGSSGSVYDRLANNIGLLRTMFKENAQRPLCPHIDEIGPAIVKTFNLTNPGDVATVYELLVLSQRASGHPVAEFDAFSHILREHSKKRDTTARKALVKKQQMLALRGMKNAGAMAGEPSSSLSAAAASNQDQQQQQQQPSSSARKSSASNNNSLAAGVPPPPMARSQSDWVGFLNQFSSKNDGRLNWTEFAGAIHNLPHTWRRGETLEPNDHWSARSFFMTCASVENLLQSPESRVATTSLSAYFVGNKVVARTSKSVAMGSTIRSAMSWESGGEDNIVTSVTSARRPGGAAAISQAAAEKQQQLQHQNGRAAAAASGPATPRAVPGENRALRLRNESQKKWIIAHPTDPRTGNVSTSLPKLTGR